MGLKSLVKRVLADKNNIRYENILENRRVIYHDWISDYEKANPLPDRPKGACVQKFGAQKKIAQKDRAGKDELFLVFNNPGGRMADDAEGWIQRWFEDFPDAVVVYGDEDIWAEDEKRKSPCFKPDWSPDLLDTRFYLGNLVAVRKSWFECRAKDSWEGAIDLPDGSEGRQIAFYHNFIRHCVKVAGGYEKGQGRKAILHIPRILYHCESEESRDRWMHYVDGEHNCGGRMCQKDDAGHADGRDGVISRRLSIVIPSKDNPDLLEKCIFSIINTTQDMQYEIVVVDNGSAPENRTKIEAKLKGIRQSGAKGLTLVLYHYEPMDFNFSKMCNLGARKASGELLLFLNDDVEFSLEGTLQAMAGLAMRPFTGAVGLKLLYPEKKAPGRIQHVGITNLPMGPVHKLQFSQDREKCYMEWNRGRHNALAVTAACLMVEKEKFQEAGGFSEELAVAFNDVDLCFHLYEHGYENVCECDFFAYHDESYSRGDDESPGKLERLLSERAKLYERHPGLDEAKRTAGTDPYYSSFLNREGLDTRIRSAYETAGNKVQEVTAGNLEQTKGKDLDSMREDICLMVRVESVLEDEGARNGIRITGWGVVLGDNNACYDKYLVFQGEQCYMTLLQEQYRPDLEENMPDQEKVALSGYQILLAKGALPAGRYRVGMVAASRINRVRLLNWTNRTIRIDGAQ